MPDGSEEGGRRKGGRRKRVRVLDVEEYKRLIGAAGNMPYAMLERVCYIRYVAPLMLSCNDWTIKIWGRG